MSVDPGSPLALAYLDLLRAKERVALKDTPTHRRQVEEARATLDTLLDAHPLVALNTPPLVSPLLPAEAPPTPDGPGASSPGPSVSLEDELLGMGKEGD